MRSFSPCDLDPFTGSWKSCFLLWIHFFFVVIISSWSPRTRPKPRSLKVQIFQILEVIYWCTDPLWPPTSPTKKRQRHKSEASLLGSTIRHILRQRGRATSNQVLLLTFIIRNCISTGRIKFLSWQLEALFTLFSEFFSPFLHSTWFAIGIAPVFSLRN